MFLTTEECLRDIGLEDDCLRLGISGKQMQYIRWCKSMTGEEYGKIPAFGGRLGNAVSYIFSSCVVPI